MESGILITDNFKRNELEQFWDDDSSVNISLCEGKETFVSLYGEILKISVSIGTLMCGEADIVPVFHLVS